MDDTMKKRLVGAVVLVALAVIFVPMLLEEKQQPVESVKLEQEIPQAPETDYRTDLIPTEKAAQEADTTTSMEIPLETITEPVRPERTEPAETETTAGESGTDATMAEKEADWVIVEDAAKSADKTTTASVETPPASSAAPDTRSGWAVQAGSFGQKANAENLMANLKLNGMEAYISEVQVADKILYRVRIGPLASKESAEQQLQLVEKNFKLKGNILPP